MFKRINDSGIRVELFVDGNPVIARKGDTVAAALLLAGTDYFRTTPVTGAKRSPFCMMGVCFDCLVKIDGVGNQQACMIAVQAGMRVERQQGRRELGQ